MNKYFNKEFLLTNKKMLIKVTAIVVIIAVAFVVFALDSHRKSSELTVSEGENAAIVQGEAVEGEALQESEPVPKNIFVDIRGAVKEPLVAELPEGSRVADAIKAAGGLKENADIESINRAAFVTDGEKIIIPKEGELDRLPQALQGQMPAVSQDSAGGDAKINLNTATTEELQKINGVGPVTAEKIVAYREEHGRFANTEELKNIDGIGDKTYEKMKESITV